MEKKFKIKLTKRGFTAEIKAVLDEETLKSKVVLTSPELALECTLFRNKLRRNPFGIEISRFSPAYEKLINKLKELGYTPGKNINVVLTLNKEDYEKVKNLFEELEELKEKIEAERERRKEARFFLRTVYDSGLDMDTEILVLNKREDHLTEEERRRYRELIESLDQVHLVKHIYFSDGSKKPEGIEVPAHMDLRGKDSFTFDEIEELFKEKIKEGKRKLEEKRAKAKRQKEELEKRRREAIEEAKRMGREVVIRTVAFIDGDDPSSQERLLFKEVLDEVYGTYGRKELGVIEVVEVALPDGRIIQKGIPSF